MYERDLNNAGKEVKTLRRALGEMNNLLEESQKKISELETAAPIKEVKRVRKGRGGVSVWPTYMWDVIMEQLVNGTPPSAVHDNINLHIDVFAPGTAIHELPSLWTIRRARTVLLVICQTLAVYRLAKADRWGQLFTDATSRRQVTFQNLLISVEEDEMFK